MIGCLCIHGFTGSPEELAPLAAYLQEKTDWQVVVPTLPGHGNGATLEGISHKDWVAYAEKELKKLLSACDEVYVIGFSMGGLIASILAAAYPVSKLVLLSAAAFYVNPRQLYRDIKEMISDSLKGNLQGNEMFQRYKRKIIHTPFSATFEFRKIVMLVRPLLKKIKIPTFIVQGEGDGIVPPKSAAFLYSRIGSDIKKIHMEPGAKHLICHCENKEQIFQAIYTFLQDEG